MGFCKAWKLSGRICALSLRNYSSPTTGPHQISPSITQYGLLWRAYSTGEAIASTLDSKDTADNVNLFKVLQPGEVMPGVTTSEVASRRKELMKLLPYGSIVILQSATVKYKTDIVPYPFRQSSDYLYYTGCPDPGGVAVIYNAGELCMFMPDPDPERDLWQGPVAQVPEAINILKADRAYNMKELPKILPRLMNRAKKIYVDDELPPDSIIKKLATFHESEGKKVGSIQRYAYEPRWIKSPAEINLMKRSASIAVQGFIQTIKASRCRPHEHVLAATMEFECRSRGAQRMAFPSAVAGGANSSVIYYFRNDQQIREGEMVLMDAGCDYYGYVSEITRTWSPSGKLSNAHKDLYQAVLTAYRDSLCLYKPGSTLDEAHKVATDRLSRAMRGFNVVKKKNDYLRVNPTAIGRYLGLDSLDCKTIHEDRKLVPGVVCTIEPGVYIPISDDFPKWYQGIGIRIQDEVLITDSGHEVLTAALPRELTEIEALFESCKLILIMIQKLILHTESVDNCLLFCRTRNSSLS